MKQDSRNFKSLAFVLALLGLLALSAGIAFGQAIDGAVVGTDYGQPGRSGFRR